MRIVHARYLEPGMRLGKAVYAPDGKILLKGGVSLTNGYIRNMERKNIPSVYIDDELSNGIEVEDAIDPEVKVQAVETIKNVFKTMSPNRNDKNRKGYVTNESYKDVKNAIYQITNNLKKNNGSLFNMVEIMSTDLATYNHCVNVSVLAIMTARAMGLDEKRIMDIGVGALMHDIGYAYVPSEIINKPGKLSDEEFEAIKKHTVYGYEMVKEDANISAIVKTIILMHHERLDGSGYPLRIKGDKINKFVRIVSICDMFEALTSDRAYREKMPVYKALELLTAETTSKLDLEIYKNFIKNIAIYPQGTGVLLNTGEKGLVVENNRNSPTRPKVRIIFNNEGNFYQGFKVVDLMKDLTTFIENTCELRY
ncbi:HD-GYP domain-containing protein [Wukongibacter sp. M2B1]|uniref:HD-GYP domain-containing protein n=1 Tax=Wukongibacter sp. M2B1 TaxID=3088895 RepID=UPI003D7B2DC1